MTFSIVALEPESGTLGIALASKFLAAGSLTMFAQAGVGALATQAWANTQYGPAGLALLAGGASAEETVGRLVGADEAREHRQLGVVDALGRSAGHTGRECIDWAGTRLGDGLAVQGNILAGREVMQAIFDTYQNGGLPFPELLVEALAAGELAGGDRRGRQSAALLVVRERAGYGGFDDRWIDVRIDDHPDPIGELRRLLELTRFYRDRPTAEELLALDESLAAELRHRLGLLGYRPGPDFRPSLSAYSEAAGVARTGEPRPTPDGWDDAWQAALEEWMAVENLEERLAAPGWLDARTLAFLRSRSGA